MLLFEKKQNNNALKAEPVSGVAPWITELLANRGIAGEKAVTEFLNPSVVQFNDPFLFADMRKAVKRIVSAVEKNENICVYGDYDADGICATAIMYRYLKSAGANVITYIPSRHNEGYGMNTAAVGELRQKGISLIITVDNGISANEEIELAYELGMEVIIIDHHICGEKLPRSHATICHTVKDGGYANPICGAFTALKVVEALAGKEAAKRYIPLAGIATVADVMPLLGENRALVHETLRMISQNDCDIGITSLLKRARKKEAPVTARDIAFLLAPRLNAAGRLFDASLALRLFCAEEQSEAEELADKLEIYNQQRQKTEQEIVEQAEAMVAKMDAPSARTIVLCSKDWNPGVMGIAASRLAEKYYRPAFLFSEDENGMMSGSGRSVRGVDLYLGVYSCREHFLRFGGHAYAAGATLKKEHFDAFKTAFEDYYQNNADKRLFIPRCEYELDAELSELNTRTANEIGLLAPFGEGNDMPLFHTSAVRAYGIKRVGSDSRQLKLGVAKDGAFVEGIAFNKGEMFGEVIEMEKLSVLYTPSVNNWNNQSTLQLEIKQIKACPVEAPDKYVEERKNKFYSAFLDNILYNGFHSSHRPERADILPLFRRLCEEEITGTLIVCSTPSGAVRLLESIKGTKQALLPISFNSFADWPFPYNRILLAPKLAELDISRYKNILLFDHQAGIIDKLPEQAQNAKVYAAEHDAGSAELKAGFDASREGLGLQYRAVCGAYSADFMFREKLADAMVRQTGAKRHQCEFALSVFLELGLLEMKSGGALAINQNSDKKELFGSRIYNEIASDGQEE